MADPISFEDSDSSLKRILIACVLTSQNLHEDACLNSKKKKDLKLFLHVFRHNCLCVPDCSRHVCLFVCKTPFLQWTLAPTCPLSFSRGVTGGGAGCPQSEAQPPWAPPQMKWHFAGVYGERPFCVPVSPEPPPPSSLLPPHFDKWNLATPLAS